MCQQFSTKECSTVVAVIGGLSLWSLAVIWKTFMSHYDKRSVALREVDLNAVRLGCGGGDGNNSWLWRVHY
jgi:hypothetical protein